MDFSALTLHQLRVFRAVAGTGNLTRAAEQLGISQPAVSMQVKQLERILGLPLLETVGRHYRLTNAGVTVNAHAVRVLGAVSDLSDAVLEIQGVDRGRLFVGADTTVGIYVMPPILGAWHQEHRAVDIDLRVGNHEEVCEWLRDADVQLAVVSTVPHIAGLDVESFLPNRLVIIAPPDHELARRTTPVPARRLADQPFLVRESGSSSRAAMEAFCAHAGIDLRIAMRLGSIGAIKQGVANGLGLGVVSERAIGNELAVGALVILNVEGFPLELEWHIVHFGQRRLSPSAASFKKFLHASTSVLHEPSTMAEPVPVVRKRLRNV